MQHAVMAVLSGQEQSIRCADALKQAGFSRDEISVLLPDDFGAQELSFGRRNRALEGFAIGAMLGAVLGGVFGYIANDLRLYVPGLSAVISSGHLTAAASMAAIVGGVFALFCAMVGMTMHEYFIHKFDRRTRHGTSLMSVHCDNTKEMSIASKILKGEGAEDVKILEEETNRKNPIVFRKHRLTHQH